MSLIDVTARDPFSGKRCRFCKSTTLRLEWRDESEMDDGWPVLWPYGVCDNCGEECRGEVVR